MADYRLQWEKEMSSGKRDELRKELITKLDEQKGDRQEAVHAKACSRPKTAELTAPKPETTIASTSTSKNGNGKCRRKGEGKTAK